MDYKDLTEEEAAELVRETTHIKKELFRIRDRKLNVAGVYCGRPCDVEKARKALDLMQTHLARLDRQASAFENSFGRNYKAEERFERESSNGRTN